MRLATVTAAILFFTTLTLSQSTPSMCPIKNFKGKTSEFGKRTHPILKTEQDHNGIDFIVPTGTRILATADGHIMQAETIENWGVVVRIQHQDHFETFYAHLSKSVVKVGQTVKRGELIAYSGNSGVSTGPHLHYEVVQNGVNENPRKFIAAK